MAFSFLEGLNSTAARSAYPSSPESATRAVAGGEASVGLVPGGNSSERLTTSSPTSRRSTSRVPILKAGALEGQQTGRKPEELRVEATDVLFVPGRPRYRYIFLRDAAGKITGLAQRREAWDLVWKRE
jgi:hypothetical protein